MIRPEELIGDLYQKSKVRSRMIVRRKRTATLRSSAVCHPRDLISSLKNHSTLRVRCGAAIFQNAADVGSNICGSDSTFAHGHDLKAQQDKLWPSQMQ